MCWRCITVGKPFPYGSVSDLEAQMQDFPQKKARCLHTGQINSFRRIWLFRIGTPQ